MNIPILLLSRRSVFILAASVGLACGGITAAHAQFVPPPSSPVRDGPDRSSSEIRPSAPDNVPPVNLQSGDVALRTAQGAATSFAAGTAWVQSGPEKDPGVEATILLQNRVVARLRFRVTDGSLLPAGYKPGATVSTSTTSADSLAKVQQALPKITSRIRVLPALAVAGREGFWRVPLVYENRIVADLMISGDGTKVVEDFAAARDAAIYVR